MQGIMPKSDLFHFLVLCRKSLMEINNTESKMMSAENIGDVLTRGPPVGNFQAAIRADFARPEHPFFF